MTIPATFQAHFLVENSRTQLVFFAEVYESNAGSFQLLYQLNLNLLC